MCYTPWSCLFSMLVAAWDWVAGQVLCVPRCDGLFCRMLKGMLFMTVVALFAVAVMNVDMRRWLGVGTQLMLLAGDIAEAMVSNAVYYIDAVYRVYARIWARPPIVDEALPIRNLGDLFHR